MTTTTDPNSTLTDLEARFAEHLAVPAEVQDLLFREAHTANTFTDEPVTDEQIRAIVDLVKWGPTAMNIQPLRIVMVRSAEARERLVTHLAEGNRAKTLTAPAVAILAADTNFHDQMHKTFPHNPGARENFVGDDAQREQTAHLNSALQIGYFIVGVRAAGLAAGPMAGFDPAGVAEEFFPGGQHRPMVMVNFGHPGPDAFRPRLPRLPFDDVVQNV